VKGPAEKRVADWTAVLALAPCLHKSVASANSPDFHVLRRVGQVHLYLVGDVLVEGVGRLDQAVATARQVADEAGPSILKYSGGIRRAARAMTSS